MTHLSLPGVDLWHEDSGGSGDAVIFLHAASMTSDSWVHQVPAFTAAGYRCVTYDRRYWGRSRATDPQQQPGFSGADLVALMDALSLESAHLVATAAGGITALGFALAHPERARSLVAANTIGGVQDEAYLEVQHRLRPFEIQNLPVELRELGPSYRATNPDGAARWLEIERSSRPEGAVPAQPTSEGITYAQLGTIRIPSLVLCGDADLLSPPALMRLLADHIPTSRYVSLGRWGIPDSGSGPMLGMGWCWSSLRASREPIRSRVQRVVPVAGRPWTVGSRPCSG